MTELIYEGKYKDGKKTAPVRIPLQLQAIALLQYAINLENLIIPPGAVPEVVRGIIIHLSQRRDYCSVDGYYKADIFHIEWQSYRTKQNPKIDLTAYNHYEEKGKYTLLVKVIDDLGNDTTKAITIEIA